VLHHLEGVVGAREIELAESCEPQGHRKPGRLADRRQSTARDDELLVRQALQVAVAAVDGEERGADPTGVGQPLEQVLGGVVRRDDEQRLTASRGLDPVESDGQMLRRTRWWRPADQGRRQGRDAGEARLVVEVRGEVPRFVRRRTHEQQAVAVVGRSAQRSREATGAVDPPRAREHVAQQPRRRLVHGGIVPYRGADWLDRPMTESAAPSPYDLPDVSDLVVGVLGGTGEQGRGLAHRLAGVGQRVVIGSRSLERAQAAAAELGRGVAGADNAGCAAAADIVIVAVPYDGHRELLASLTAELDGKLVVDCVNPLGFDKQGAFGLTVEEGSAAQQAAAVLPGSRVVGAFHHVSAVLLLDDAVSTIDTDVLVLGDDRAATDVVQALAARIPGMRGVYAGRLRNAGQVEAMTANLISMNRRYKAHAGLVATDLSHLLGGWVYGAVAGTRCSPGHVQQLRRGRGCPQIGPVAGAARSGSR
jgi:NADPH-dependent F420 reductase